MSFTSNVQISKNYPGVLYDASETSGTWHEDHEINGAMYHAANAKFDDQTSHKWSLKNASLPAYATAQNTDGSMTYLYMPAGSPDWSTSAWLGTGQPVLYHVVNYGMSPNSSASENAAALQAAVTAALNGGGGVIFIPAGTYPLSDVTNLDFSGLPAGTDPGFIITGAGATTILRQTDVTKDVFSISGATSGKGVRFKDLRIAYDTTTTTPTTLAAAIRVASGCDNVSCERVYFKDCPQSFYTESLHCGLFNCTIDYDNFGTGTGSTVIPTMVNLNGTENYIDSCNISQQSRGDPTNPGPIGCIGILVANAGGAYYITNTHLAHFTQGIVVRQGPNLARVFCSNVICESWTNALVVQPTGSSGKIYQVYCDDCLFALADASTDSSATGVIIDTSGGANGNVSDIFLNNCMVVNWKGPGVQINAGQDIVITGGRYGSNAAGTNYGGIAITGTAANVTINGADLTPTVPGDSTQPYALSITAAVAGLYVRGCNMTGYGTPNVPLYLSSPGTQIEITDCAGYNDQGKIVSTTAPSPSGTQFNGTYSGFSTPYFGPVTFYVRSGTGTITHIKLNGTDTGLTSGTFSVGPGAWKAEIDYTGTGLNFLMIGY